MTILSVRESSSVLCCFVSFTETLSTRVRDANNCRSASSRVFAHFAVQKWRLLPGGMGTCILRLLRWGCVPWGVWGWMDFLDWALLGTQRLKCIHAFSVHGTALSMGWRMQLVGCGDWAGDWAGCRAVLAVDCRCCTWCGSSCSASVDQCQLAGSGHQHSCQLAGSGQWVVMYFVQWQRWWSCCLMVAHTLSFG